MNAPPSKVQLKIRRSARACTSRLRWRRGANRSPTCFSARRQGETRSWPEDLPQRQATIPPTCQIYQTRRELQGWRMLAPSSRAADNLHQAALGHPRRRFCQTWYAGPPRQSTRFRRHPRDVVVSKVIASIATINATPFTLKTLRSLFDRGCNHGIRFA